MAFWKQSEYNIHFLKFWQNFGPLEQYFHQGHLARNPFQYYLNLAPIETSIDDLKVSQFSILPEVCKLQ